MNGGKEEPRRQEGCGPAGWGTPSVPFGTFGAKISGRAAIGAHGLGQNSSIQKFICFCRTILNGETQSME
jgi:hypothetical protein